MKKSVVKIVSVTVFVLLSSSVLASDFSKLSAVMCDAKKYMRSLSRYCGEKHPGDKQTAEKLLSQWLKVNGQYADKASRLCHQLWGMEKKYSSCAVKASEAVNDVLVEQAIDELKRQKPDYCKSLIKEYKTTGIKVANDLKELALLNRKKIKALMDSRKKQLEEKYKK